MTCKELTDFERGVIVGCFISGKSQRETMVLTGHPKTTVADTIRRYVDTGSVSSSARCGRPRIFSDRDKRNLKRLVHADRTASLLQISTTLDVASPSTVRRTLHELGFYGRAGKKKPLITEANRKKRLTWCNERKLWTFADWANIIWSDESRFSLFKSDGRVWVWRQKHERYNHDCVVPTVKYEGGSLMVWSCFTPHAIGPLIICPDRVSANEYIKILEKGLLPYYPTVPATHFQHDHAPCHTAKVVKDWFLAQHINVLEWVAQSPDLNAIEKLWEELEKRIRRRRPLPSSLAVLAEYLQEEWRNIPLDFLASVVNSMPDRVKEVIKCKGHCTKN